ncbi:sulfatase-like hydrolase/transferase [Propioniciclava coleopterorum]|uniref:Sulfatase-like hydrolase/transferase n=1 Tax=Propioniciclava coleopterorum TaxID=2714937 RepID=A0A6G7Y5Y2_9ACTN|nr:sulfatase-like hydrolase/transferase [Propioniciclava coleopterorum]QIK72031.1 sulfatase-like hydrolase/transferase [Propioniciclava coleopterorum]
MAKRPNIVWVMTDQHRADLTWAAGEAGPVMPTLRGLASRGSTFDRAYTSTPACVPARVSLLTGRFPSVHQVRQNSNETEARFAADLLDVLGAHGYETFFAGKPHMHRGPADFDHFRGPYMHTGGPATSPDQAAFDAWLDGLDHSVSPVATPFPLECQLPHRIVDDALADLRAARPAGPDDRPFFLWVSFPEPHNPYQVPEPYFSMFDDVARDHERRAGPEAIDELSWRYRWLRDLIESKRPGYDEDWRRYLATYLGMLRMVDDQIARLLAGLGAHLDDTLVFFLADHGDYVGEYGLQRKGAGLPEVLTRIPLIVAGPGVPEGERRTEMVSIVDVLPTVCGLAGLEPPRGSQGRDLTGLWAGRDAGEEFATAYVELGYGGVAYGVDARPPLHFDYAGPTFDELNSVTQSGHERMLRLDDLKLVMDAEGRRWLYDLASDPGETRNLADDPAHRDALATLTWWLARWLMRVDDDLPAGRYTPRIPADNWRWAPEALDAEPPPSAAARTDRPTEPSVSLATKE